MTKAEWDLAHPGVTPLEYAHRRPVRDRRGGGRMVASMDRDLYVRVHAGAMTPSQGFAAQARRDAGLEPLHTPNAASLAPFATMETPPPARPVGIHAIWLAEAPKMAAATGAAHDLYMAHEAAIECRSDLTDCQKNARRRMVLEYWYAEQGRAAEQPAPPKPADDPATAWRDPRTGPGIPR